MNRVFNKPVYKRRRQVLRTNMTVPERLLWQCLRGEQLGVKFRRQHGIGDYIVDFYCSEKGFVVEVDGDSHFTDDAVAYDAVRDAFLMSLGLRVMRFTNQQVMHELESVCNMIRQHL
jgi:very-short-patch-repair endonuclease